jgi:hypothetical protein
MRSDPKRGLWGRDVRVGSPGRSRSGGAVGHGRIEPLTVSVHSRRAVTEDGQRQVELTRRCRAAGSRLPSPRRPAPWPRWCSERPPPGARGLCVPAGSWFRRSGAPLCVRGRPCVQAPCEPMLPCEPVPPCGWQPCAHGPGERSSCQSSGPPSSRSSWPPSSRRISSPLPFAPSSASCSCVPPPSSRRHPSAPTCR